MKESKSVNANNIRLSLWNGKEYKTIAETVTVYKYLNNIDKKTKIL